MQPRPTGLEAVLFRPGDRRRPRPPRACRDTGAAADHGIHPGPGQSTRPMEGLGIHPRLDGMPRPRDRDHVVGDRGPASPTLHQSFDGDLGGQGRPSACCSWASPSTAADIRDRRSGCRRWAAGLDRLSLLMCASLAAFLQPWVLVGAAASVVAGIDASSWVSLLILAGFCLLATATQIGLELAVLLSPRGVGPPARASAPFPRGPPRWCRRRHRRRRRALVARKRVVGHRVLVTVDAASPVASRLTADGRVQ